MRCTMVQERRGLSDDAQVDGDAMGIYIADRSDADSVVVHIGGNGVGSDKEDRKN